MLDVKCVDCFLFSYHEFPVNLQNEEFSSVKSMMKCVSIDPHSNSLIPAILGK